MVWWIPQFTRPSNSCRSGALSYFTNDDENDIIYQTSNIMFTFNHKMYDSDDIYSLICCGINIFNIDLTVEDKSFLQKIKDVISNAESLPTMFPSKYYRPTSIAVTMAINKTINIDERVDIVILKEITTAAEFLDSKKQNSNLRDKIIMVWLKKWTFEEMNIIKFSDGVVLDLVNDDKCWNEFCSCPLNFCKEYQKPVFYVKNNILSEYYQVSDRDRLLNVIANEVVKNRLDGIIVVDSNVEENPPKEMIRSLVRALDCSEKDIDVSKEYYDKSFKAKIPMLPPLSIAFAASLSALTSGARVIIVLSATGISPRLISSSAPPCPIICVIKRKSTARRLHLYRKVIPVFYKTNRSMNWHQECRSRIHFGTTFALKIGLLETGAKLVVVQPLEETNGYCNSFRILSIPLQCEE